MILLTGFRKWYSPDTTIGELYSDKDGEQKEMECYTLEDTARPKGVKVQDYTAIPAGVLLNVGIRYSPGLKRKVIILYTEPDKITLKGKGVEFTYVYFHALNNSKQTDGCVGVGKTKSGNTIGDARKAERELFKKVKKWLESGETVKAIFVNEPFTSED